MQKTTHDPKKGAQKVTNADEQEVVVNHSTSSEGGFDEPVNQQESETKPVEQTPSKEAPTPERSRSGRPKPADDRKKKFHEEETE